MGVGVCATELRKDWPFCYMIAILEEALEFIMAQFTLKPEQRQRN